MSSKKSNTPAKKGPYLWSVFFALLSVACCIAPYFIGVIAVHKPVPPVCQKAASRIWV